MVGLSRVLGGPRGWALFYERVTGLPLEASGVKSLREEKKV